MKLPEFFDQLILAKNGITQTLPVSSTRVAKVNEQVARSLKIVETVFGLDCCYYLHPSSKGTPYFSQPVFGASVSGKHLLLCEGKAIFSPKIDAVVVGGGQIALKIGESAFKVKVAAQKDILIANTDDLSANPREDFRLVGCLLDQKSTGTLRAVDVEVFEAGDKKEHRYFLETDSTQYQIKKNTDVLAELKANIGAKISGMTVGTLYLGWAIKVDDMQLDEDATFEATISAVETAKKSYQGRSFDSYTVVTDKGAFYPNKQIRSLIKRGTNLTGMTLVKVGKTSAQIRSQALADAYADL